MAINSYLNSEFLDLSNNFLYNSISENNIKVITNYFRETLNILENQNLLSNYKDITDVKNENLNWIYSLQDELFNKNSNFFNYNSYSRYNILYYNNFGVDNIISIVDSDLLFINNFYNRLYNKDISYFYIYYLYIGYLNNFDILNLENKNSIITKYINTFNNKNKISKYLQTKCRNENCHSGLINFPFFCSLFLKEFVEKTYSGDLSNIKNNIKNDYPLNFSNNNIKYSFKKATSLFDLNDFSFFFSNSILKIPIKEKENNDFIKLLSSKLSHIFDLYTQDYDYENSIQKAFDSYVDNRLNSKKLEEKLFDNLFLTVFKDVIVKNFDFDSFFINKEQLITQFNNYESDLFQSIKENLMKKKKFQIRSIEYINSQFKEEFNNFILTYPSSYMMYYNYLIENEFHFEIGIYSLLEEDGDDYLTIENFINAIKNNINTKTKLNYNIKNDVLNAINYSFLNTFFSIVEEFCNSDYLNNWIEDSLIENIYDVSIIYRNLYANNLFLNHGLIKFYIEIMLKNLILNNFDNNIDKLFNFEYNTFKSKIKSIPNNYFDKEFNPNKFLNFINNQFNSDKKQNIKSFSNKIKKEYLALFLSKFINESLYRYKI